MIERLRSVNPLTALAGAVLLVVAAYAVPAPAGPLGRPRVGRCSWRRSREWDAVLIILAAAVAIPTWIFLAVMNALVAPQGPTIRVAGIVLAPDALVPAAWIALRLGAAVAALGWVVVTTPPQRLVRALAQRGLPAWSQYLLAASLAAVPEGRDAVHRRCSRRSSVAGCASPVARSPGLRALLSLAGPLMVSLVTDAERHGIALDARAFHARGKRTWLTAVADSDAERVLRTAMWGATVALIAWGLLQ